MYRCQKCHGLSLPGELSAKVIVETRTKEYPRREYAVRVGRGMFMHWIADPGGFGVEIAREEIRHERCAASN